MADDRSPNPQNPAAAAPAQLPSSPGKSTQLSVPNRVSEGVGSIAMSRGMLAAAGERRPEEVVEHAAPAVLEGLEDSDVMLRVKAGDNAAFDYLIAKYRRPVVHFMYRMTHNRGIAEELAQEVFLRVYRSREGYEASAKFTTWMYRIATNLAVNHARDTKYERPENTVSLDEPDYETGQTLDVPDSTLSVEQN